MEFWFVAANNMYARAIMKASQPATMMGNAATLMHRTKLPGKKQVVSDCSLMPSSHALHSTRGVYFFSPLPSLF